MQLGDIFDRTFRVCVDNFLPNLFVVLICCGIPCGLLTGALHFFYSLLPGMMEGMEGEPHISSVIAVLALFFGMMVIGGMVAIGVLAGEIGVTILTSKRMFPGASYPEYISTDGSDALPEFFKANPGYTLAPPPVPPLMWRDGIDSTIVSRILRLIGFYMIGVGAVVITGVMLAVSFAILPYQSMVGGLMIFGMFVVLLPIAVYLMIRWSFVVQVISWENLHLFDAMRRSGRLVEGRWWRVFGILFLLGLMVGFATSLLTTPVSFFGMFSGLRGAMQSGGSSPEATNSMMRSMGTGVGLAMSVSIIFSMLIKPVYTTVLYFDLRAHNGEMLRPEPVPPPQTPSPDSEFMPKES